MPGDVLHACGGTHACINAHRLADVEACMHACGAPGQAQVRQVHAAPGHGILIEPDGLQEGPVKHAL